jgi:hypothetical protein
MLQNSVNGDSKSVVAFENIHSINVISTKKNKPRMKGFLKECFCRDPSKLNVMCNTLVSNQSISFRLMLDFIKKKCNQDENNHFVLHLPNKCRFYIKDLKKLHEKLLEKNDSIFLSNLNYVEMGVKHLEPRLVRVTDIHRTFLCGSIINVPYVITSTGTVSHADELLSVMGIPSSTMSIDIPSINQMYRKIPKMNIQCFRCTQKDIEVFGEREIFHYALYLMNNECYSPCVWMLSLLLENHSFPKFMPWPSFGVGVQYTLLLLIGDCQSFNKPEKCVMWWNKALECNLNRVDAWMRIVRWYNNNSCSRLAWEIIKSNKLIVELCFNDNDADDDLQDTNNYFHFCDEDVHTVRLLFCKLCVQFYDFKNITIFITWFNKILSSDRMSMNMKTRYLKNIFVRRCYAIAGCKYELLISSMNTRSFKMLLPVSDMRISERNDQFMIIETRTWGKTPIVNQFRVHIDSETGRITNFILFRSSLREHKNECKKEQKVDIVLKTPKNMMCVILLHGKRMKLVIPKAPLAPFNIIDDDIGSIHAFVDISPNCKLVSYSNSIRCDKVDMNGIQCEKEYFIGIVQEVS